MGGARSPSCALQWGTLLLVLASMMAAAAAARPAQQAQTIEDNPATVITTTTTAPVATESKHEQGSLMTYYFDVEKPDIQLLPAAQGSARPDRTPLRVKLSAPAVSTFMPIISPRPTGMTHAVVKTWTALQNYALMFERVNAINRQAAPNSPRLFPMPCVALAAASGDNPADVRAVIDAAEARGDRSAWTETPPGSVLLMPTGQSVAAIADVLNIAYDEASGSITLDLDVVHKPKLVTEFEAHGKQVLDTNHAHYHLYPANGVKVDAAAVLKVLQESGYKLPGAHVFVKGACQPPYTVRLTTGNIEDDIIVTADIQCTSSPIGSGCRNVLWSLNGPYDSATPSCCGESCELSASIQADTISGQATSGVATLAVRCTKGPLTVSLTTVSGNTNVRPNSITICGGAVSQLVLSPAKAYRHVHERMDVTVLALDATGAAVPGVAVTFGASGDCSPDLSTATTTTDATGRAIASISAKKPGAVAVVAAATSATGARLLTPPAHIIFFGDHEYVEERERDYYGGRHDEPRYGATEGYGEAKADPDSDAERFAAEATKKALAQLPA